MVSGASCDAACRDAGCGGRARLAGPGLTMATVLVVDDHPLNRDLVVTLLGYRGHTVLEAGDGAEALKIARARLPDLVITDLVMPVMDGYELVRELRRDPQLATTRVIFYTANYLHHEVTPMAAALGVAHVLFKPAEPEALLAAADAALAAAPAAPPLAEPDETYQEYARALSAKLADKVDELLAAETLLKESEARYRSLTEASPMGVFSLNCEGRVSYSNPRLREICGAPDGAAAYAWTDLLHTEDSERMLAGLVAAVEAGAPYRDRVRIVQPTGGLRWADVQASPVPGASGQISHVGTVDDVTDTLEAGRQRDELLAGLHAERADARFRGLLEAAPDAVVCVDSGGRIVLVNAQTERLFGYRREELVGQRVEILVPDPIKASHPSRRAGYVADPRSRAMGEGMELAARCHDGSTFPAEISLSTIDTDEGVLVMAAVRDVTDRLELQAGRERLRTQAERERLQNHLNQSQRLESLGQLAGGVAHDFNNLLAVISSYAAFVAEEVASGAPKAGWESVRDDIHQIEQAAQRAAGLTRQLLAFARREVIQPRVLDLNDTITDVEQLLIRTLGEHVELATELATEPCPVLADPGQIEQVLVNLAVNARDAMPGGGQLAIKTATADVDAVYAAGRAGLSPGRYVSLKVSDTGAGMPQEVMNRAFEPFFSTKTKTGGAGLGLATVYGIITQADGYVQIYSEPGLGTAVTILLPATSQIATTPAAPKEQAPPPHGGGRTVLLVEDEAALREVTQRILVRNGYEVITAANGRDAVQVATKHPGSIELLVTDVVMPQMAGKEAAEQISALYPAAKVLFMSGYTAGALDTGGILEAGVNLIEKPFNGASLLAKLHEIMSETG
jgi:PAS domain S-box-containing protein